MAKSNTSILYNGGWNLPIPGEYSNPVASNAKSVKNNKGSKATLFRPALKAFVMYCLDGHNPFTGDERSFRNNIYAGIAKENNIVIAEYRPSELETHICAFDTNKQEILFAGITYDGGNSYQRYTLNFDAGQNGTVIWLALIPYLMDNSKEINETVITAIPNFEREYDELFKRGKALSTDLVKLAYIFCDSCYWTINKTIAVNIPISGILPTVPSDVVKTGAYRCNESVGKFSVIGMSNGSKTIFNKTTTADELYCKYALNENMSAEEKALVPQMPEWYVVPNWVEKAAHNVQFHFKNNALATGVKQNNLFLFGEPGSGKSEGSKAIASALGLPFTHISMSANSDEFVFTGNIIPNVEIDTAKSNDLLKSFGSVDEMMNAMELAPDSVYTELTGKIKEDATIADCLDAYVSLKSKSNTVSYKFVESDFCKAIENGWLVTIEEFTNVRDAGIAMVINQLMDGYQQITLPTGKVIKRHPRAVIVFASNVDEAQCGEFEVSTLSRLKPMYKIETPSRSELIKRVERMTGFSDADTLDIMADVCVTLRTYIKEHALAGVCGVREFAGWILQYQANTDFDSEATLREAALETIVPSASPHEEDMEEIIRDVIDIMITS